jgi:hypothetical protein
MQSIAKLTLILVALALAGCGTADRPAASGDIAQATADPAYPAPNPPKSACRYPPPN